MFGDPMTNPMGWEVKPLSKICDVRDGTHDSPEYVMEGYPLVTSKNVTSGELNFADVNYISVEDYTQINRRSKVDNGDIIMPMIGTIGKPVIVNTERKFAIKNVALMKFNKTDVLNIYIWMLLSSNYFDVITKDHNRGGTQKFIALGDIRKLPIPLPPLSLQHRFTDFVRQTDKSKFVMKSAYKKAKG